MKHVNKSVLLWYSTHEMYALVTAIEDYPQFLPWCAEARVLSRSDEGMKARITLAFSGVRHAFTTMNRHDEDRAVQVSLVDGPFSQLDGHWQFLPLGPGSGAGSGEGDAAQQACKIEFDMRYAFANGPLEAIISPVFGRIANSLVDSFVRRAEQVYGPR